MSRLGTSRPALAAGGILLAGWLAGCSQLGPGIPTMPPATQATPAAAATAAVTVPQVSAAASAASAQLGVQIFWHDVNDPDAAKNNAARLLDYVLDVGANSVGISFPIYTDGAWPTRVYPESGVTPAPDSVRTLISEAKARGLRVMLRPIIDEQNIGNGAGAWRGSIEPRNIAAWFASYQQTLMPFLAVAQAAHADTFVLGSELDSLVGQAEQWRTLRVAAAAVFTGRLSYADNWGQWATGRPGVAGVDPGLDAYPQLHLSDSATVAQISAAWVGWLRRRPAELSATVVQEVGIAATPGAYDEPASWAVPGQTLAPQIQVRWFAGACNAVRSLQMSGIYFWNLDAWADPAKADSYAAGSFIGRGDSAIKACFADGWPGQ